ncbi:MAG: PKD domain-containing protein, partial [Deltaproteobacteria bacterium]|nr:PKD domain-containing protein [Deltaproteobacteria bacterium]
MADAGGPYTVKEGATAQLNGSATDPDFQPISFSWDLDNDGQFESPGQTVVFNAVNRDGPSVQTVVLKATDNGGLSSTAEATITVENAAPTLNGLVNNGPVDEGSTATVTAAATDPASDALTYQFDFNNDGVFEVSQASSSATHTFPDNGVFTVHARARDDDGGVSGTLSTVVTVKSISPTVKAGEDQSTQEGTAISFNGSFTDPGSDTH